jgi:hypothetical protein
MCKFPSFIIDKKGKVYGDGTIDEHEELIDKYGLSESDDTRSWVRIECEAKDDDIFNTKLSNWTIKCDEQNIPDWFERQRKTLYEPQILKVLKKVLHEMMLSDQELDVLDGKRFFLKNCKIVKVQGSTKIMMWGSSVVQEMWGSSVVQRMGDSSVVQRMWDSSVVQRMGDSSVVQKWSSDSKIEAKKDAAVIIDRANKKILVCAKEMTYP